MIWFTANLRFGDVKALAHRPSFPTVEQMDQAVIEKWNQLVKEHDDVWVVGNFTKLDPAGYRSQLKGRIHLVRGDQDHITKNHPFTDVWYNYMLRVNNQFIWLSHYPHLVWPKETYGQAWHLYGRHYGGSIPQLATKKMMDVSIDTHIGHEDGSLVQDLGLFSYEEIAMVMAARGVKTDLASVDTPK